MAPARHRAAVARPQPPASYPRDYLAILPLFTGFWCDVAGVVTARRGAGGAPARRQQREGFNAYLGLPAPAPYGVGGAGGGLPGSPICIASQRGLTFPRFLLDGPRTRRWVTVSAPSSSARRWRIWGASRRSWDAHASESAATVSSPWSNVSGVVWAATWGPTIAGQLPKTEPTAARACQPRAESRSPRAVLRSSGSSRLGRADQIEEIGVSGVGGVRSGSAEEDWREPAVGWGRSPRAQASALALARASVASRMRSGSGGTG